MSSVESAEAIKGPSGTYEDRGTVGGAVNILTKTPKLEHFTEGTLPVDNATYKRVTADDNYQIGERTVFRLNVMTRGAVIAGHDVTGFSRWGVMLSIAVGLGTPTCATLLYHHLQSNDTPDMGTSYNNSTFDRRTNGHLQLFDSGNGASVSADHSVYYGLLHDFRRDRVDTGTFTLRYDVLSALKLRNAMRIARTSQDTIRVWPNDSQGNIYYGMVWHRTNSRFSMANTVANQTETTDELSTGGLKHSYAAGLELSHERSSGGTYAVAAGSNRCPNGIGTAGGYNCANLFNSNPNDPWAGSIRLNNNPIETTVCTQLAHVFDTVEPSPRWQVNGGLRLDRCPIPATTPANTQGVCSSFSHGDNSLNYQFGPVFKSAQNDSIYLVCGASSAPSGSVANQGVDASALTPDCPSNRGDVLVPEKNRAYELGTKWDVLDSKLALTAVIPRIKTINARIVQQGSTVAMVGSKRVDGLELGRSGASTSRWQVFGGYTYLKSEPHNSGGVGAASDGASGTAFPNTLENGLSLWTIYQPIPKLMFDGGAYHVSKVWGSASPANPKWVLVHWRFDAMAVYRINRHTTLQLNVRNVSDEVYFNQAYISHYTSLTPGRTAVLTLDIRY